MRPALLLALLGALLPVPLAAGPADRESAVFFAGEGDKAVGAGDFERAEQEFRRALEEDGTFLPARHGLALSLLGLGQAAEGIEELRRFAAEVKADASAPPEWRALQAKAERRVAASDAAAAEIRRLVDRYADDLVALAGKWAEKDPSVAERAARRALRLRPGDAKAAELLAKVDAAPKGAPVPLFNGVDLKNWDGVEVPFFQLSGGSLLGEVPQGSRQIRTLQSISGDYDLKIEARVLEEKAGGDATFSLLGAYRGTHDFVGIGVMNRKVYFYDRTSQKDKRVVVKVPIAEWKAPFDPAQWNTYELRFREEEITALINGVVVGSEERPDQRHEGFAGLFVQWMKVEFRKVELQRR